MQLLWGNLQGVTFCLLLMFCYVISRGRSADRSYVDYVAWSRQGKHGQMVTSPWNANVVLIHKQWISCPVLYRILVDASDGAKYIAKFRTKSIKTLRGKSE